MENRDVDRIKEILAEDANMADIVEQEAVKASNTENELLELKSQILEYQIILGEVLYLIRTTSGLIAENETVSWEEASPGLKQKIKTALHSYKSYCNPENQGWDKTCTAL